MARIWGVIVVGGGHSGLGHAAYLARAELCVTRCAVALVASSILALASSCGGADEPPGGADASRPDGPSVILISLDTLRADRLGCYGRDPSPSPALDALAAEGLRFREVRASSPWTLPSHASLFTGLDVASHGVRGEHDLLSPELPTLAERFRDAGYATAAITDGLYLHRVFGLDRGFEHFDDGGGRLRKVGRRANRWLDAEDRRPFFLFLHAYDTHSIGPEQGDRPYASAEEHELRFASDLPMQVVGDGSVLEEVNLGRRSLDERGLRALSGLYDAAVATMDEVLGELLAGWRERGLLEDTIVCVVSDHGEAFLEHEVVGHGSVLYEEVLRVPWILRIPGGEVGVREEPVRLVDVGPTLAALAGLADPGDLDGRSRAGVSARANGIEVLAEMDGADVMWPRAMKQRGFRYEFRSCAVREGDHKLIYWPGSDRVELYDLASDPGEAADLADQRPEVVERLRAAAEEALRRAPRAAPEEGAGPVELLKALKALGYLPKDD